MFEEQGIMMEGILSKDAAIGKIVAMAGSSSELGSVTKHVVESCYRKISALGAQKDNLGCSLIAGTFLDCVPSMMFTVSTFVYSNILKIGISPSSLLSSMTV